MNINRARGVEFIPEEVSTLSIETSSLCNLDCVFCAYGKKQSPKLTMSNEMFASAILQALELGYNEYDLTPCTGDVFMDRHLFDKLTLLDETPGVKGYGFYTNFCVPRPKDIDRLVALKKLSGIGDQRLRPRPRHVPENLAHHRRRLSPPGAQSRAAPRHRTSARNSRCTSPCIRGAIRSAAARARSPICSTDSRKPAFRSS